MIHARDDCEIPYSHSDTIFRTVANATMEGPAGIDIEMFEKMKARNTFDLGDGASISTWQAAPGKLLQEIIVSYGGHNRVMTFAPVALSALRAFGVDEGSLFEDQ